MKPLISTLLLGALALGSAAHAANYEFRFAVQGLKASEPAGVVEEVNDFAEPGDSGAWVDFAGAFGLTAPVDWSAGVSWRNLGLDCIPMGGGACDAYLDYYPASTVTGDFLIDRNNLTNVEGLASITSVSGYFALFSNNLSNIEGLRNLTSVGSDFSLWGNNLTNVDALLKVASVGGGLWLQNNNLSDVNGLQNLTSLAGGVNLHTNANLVNLSGLSNLTTFGGTSVMIDEGIHTRPGFVGIQGGALCDPANASLFDSGYAQQTEVCQ